MKNSIPVDAAGGVVFRIADNDFYLLLIHRNGFWDLPKGKVESGESYEMAAVREVAEETGVSLPMIVSSLGTTFHTYEMKGKAYEKTTYWFSMILSEEGNFIPQKKEGIKEVKWVGLKEAIEILGFDNLKAIVDRFKKSMMGK